MNCPRAAAEIELPREERVRRLLAALGEDPQLAGLALVVRDLMAALRLPRTLTQADEIALGGAADIGNRGPLDRLLLSELAHDDLTLASRVALNEALYLRREPPAHRPRRTLGIVLDSGVRMWGVPRVLGVAAALSLLARQPGDSTAFLWRATGRDLVPIDLLSAQGLESYLATLVTDLDPGSALPALAEVLANFPALDLVIVTHRDALDDAAFQARLAQLTPGRGFLLLVERDGDVQLHAMPWGSPRPLAQARIDVEKLFRPGHARPRAAALTQPEPGEWPAIFRERPFPLLLPVNAKAEHAVSFGAAGACATTDGRLFSWENTKLGARQLAADLPHGKTSWLHRDARRRTVLVRGNAVARRASVVIVSADGVDVRRVSFPGPANPAGAWVEGEMLLVDVGREVVAVSLERGEVVAETRVPATAAHMHGRYYTMAGTSLAFASWQGDRVVWDSPAAGRSLPPREMLTVFDRGGIGAWIATRDGRLIGPTGEEWMKTGLAPAVAQVRDDGETVFLQQRDTAWFRIELAARKVTELPKVAWASERAREIIPPLASLQTRFTAIAASPGEPIRLLNAKGRWLEFSTRTGGALHLGASATVPADARHFETFPAPDELGCNLRIARWREGSCAWLDSRGLLHLRSADPGLPEMSFVLAYQSPVAAWCTGGLRLGPAFFHGADEPTMPELVRERLQQFCAALC